MHISTTEENYLKAIYGFTKQADQSAHNQSIADKLNINPASVTDMLRKLNEKKLISYNRKSGAVLTSEGLQFAAKTIRKHRLWETFLVHQLNFTWDEVHEVAEQLEHIKSEKLINEMDKLLGYPKFDPHGDPIPDADGNFTTIEAKTLAQIEEGTCVQVITVADASPDFLKYLHKQGVGINNRIVIKEIQAFDGSLLIELSNGREVYLSPEAAKKIWVL